MQTVVTINHILHLLPGQRWLRYNIEQPGKSDHTENIYLGNLGVSLGSAITPDYPVVVGAMCHPKHLFMSLWLV